MKPKPFLVCRDGATVLRLFQGGCDISLIAHAFQHEVSELRHVGLPDGIAIPDDVVLLPIDHDDMSNEDAE